jgi:hypothetical protein
MHHNICQDTINSLVEDQLINPACSEIISFIFNSAIVTYDNRIWLQTKGQPMGTNMAVPLADVFMLKNFEFNPAINAFIQNFCRWYGRYLDDIGGIWTGSQDEFNEFFNLANTLIPGIAFEKVIAHSTLDILDITLFRTPDPTDPNFDIVQVKCHQKALNLYQYPHATSSHPTGTKTGFIKGELIRYVRNSSTLPDFLNLREKFKRRLQNRHYTSNFIDSIFETVSYNNRQQFLQGTLHDDAIKIIPIVVPFTPRITKLRLGSILRKLQTYYPRNRFVCAYKLSRNLGARVRNFHPPDYPINQ